MSLQNFDAGQEDGMLNSILLRNAVALMASTVMVAAATGCSRDAQAVGLTPQEVQQRYGIADAYRGQVVTTDGTLRGTLVPVTLPDGRKAELIIPDRSGEPHAAYFRDGDGLHPIEVADNIKREQLTGAPVVVSKRADRAHPRHRSWEKEVMIIGGSAGAGAAVGALTGGKKGAGIGAGAGGIGGLIYDLATRKNP
jgi:hypothetical protein